MHVLGLAIAVGAVAAQEPRAAVPALLNPPNAGGAPVEVGVGFWIADFARITAREESFDVTGYLELRWHDPRLAVADPPEGLFDRWGERPLKADQLWRPQFYFVNALDQPKSQLGPDLSADRAGNVSCREAVIGKFSSRMNLRRFPFDDQVLVIRGSLFRDESIARLRVLPDAVGVDRRATATDWDIKGSRARLADMRYGQDPQIYAEFTMEVEVSRRATFYVWRVLVPLTLLVIVSWSVFWFEPAGLQPMISTCMAVLLSLVAFNFAIDFAMPKVAYLTLIDKHALIGFVQTAAIVGVVARVHLEVLADRAAHARKIQRACRLIFPIAYALVTTLNILYSIDVLDV